MGMDKIFDARSSDTLRTKQKAVLSSSHSKLRGLLKLLLSEAIDPDVKCCNIDKGHSLGKLYVYFSTSSSPYKSYRLLFHFIFFNIT